MEDFGFVGAGISAADIARITTLENNEYKITYYEVVSGTSGSLTVPSQATINADEFGLSGNAILSKIDGSNKPTFESPTTSGGVVVTASLNVSTGAWTASGTYTDANVALIYSIKIKAIYYSNLTYSNIIETASVGVVTETATQTLTNKTLDSPTITVGGITVSSTELSYLDGATSNLQTQINSKLTTPTPSDYSATSTIVGFSAFTTKIIEVIDMGAYDIINYDIGGTSNATTLSFTVPNALSANAPAISSIIHSLSGATNGSGLAQLAIGAAQVNCYFNVSLSTWSASGSKRVRGTIIIQK